MSEQMLKIGVLPVDIRWADKETNLKNVEREVRAYSRDVDIVVLPELFTTAFSQDIDVLKELAEGDDGETMTLMRKLAVELEIALSGSYLAVIDGLYYNRGFIVTPDGSTTYYNKRHLFGLSAESRLFTAGEELPCIVEYKGWRVALIVCYDLRFPVWCRRGVEGNEYDLLLVVANWPVSREYAWKHLLIARAIENQAVVVGADRSGHDDYGDYDGMTYIFDSTGHPVECESIGPLSVAQVDKTALDEHRRRWPLAHDADSFKIV